MYYCLWQIYENKQIILATCFSEFDIPLCKIINFFLVLLKASRRLPLLKEEIHFFLDLMEEVIPIPSMEWEDVEQRRQEKWGSNDCTKEMMKRKFQNLCLKRVPSGDPTMPPEIWRSKHSKWHLATSTHLWRRRFRGYRWQRTLFKGTVGGRTATGRCGWCGSFDPNNNCGSW